MSYTAEFVVVFQIRRFLRSLIKTVGDRNFTKHVIFLEFAGLVTILESSVVQEDILWSLSNDDCSEDHEDHDTEDDEDDDAEDDALFEVNADQNQLKRSSYETRKFQKGQFLFSRTEELHLFGRNFYESYLITKDTFDRCVMSQTSL